MRILAAVLGRPIAHSKSPLLHRAAFAALGLDTSEYSRVDLGAEELEAFLAEHPQHTGFSLTMPLKDRLVELAVDHGWDLDDTAALTGAANTFVRSGTSTRVANTDVQGIVRAVEPHLGTCREGAGRAVILGAGATAASAILACHELGITAIDFLVRNPDRARRALTLCEELGITAATAPLERIDPSEIVISTLPAEAVPTLEWSPQFRGGVALDVAYATESFFLAEAEAHGLAPIDGTAMLVEQAVEQSAMFVEAAGAGDARDDVKAVIAAAMYRALEE